MKKIFNPKSGKTERQTLRNNNPPAEKLLWAKLKHKQLLGYKFRRQQGVDRYIVDFYCPAVKLALEIDGDSHFNDLAQGHDKQRQKCIESYGIRFLRFTNDDIYKNLAGVLEVIARFISTTPGPSLNKEGGKSLHEKG